MGLFPIRPERRLGKAHIRFYGLHKWRISPVIAILMGFGISYMPANAKWKYSGDSVELDYKIPKQIVQKRLNEFIRTIRRVRSLEIRTHDLLDYGEIKKLRNLRNLSITGPIEQILDLSSCPSLRTLAGNNSSMSKIQGLSSLPNLREVYANRVTITWFRSLPISVEYLFFTGPLPEGLDLGSLPNLKALGITQIKILDLSRISASPTKVTELLLERVKQIENLDHLPALFPKLETITFEDVPKSLKAEISKRYAEKYRQVEK